MITTQVVTSSGRGMFTFFRIVMRNRPIVWVCFWDVVTPEY